MNKQEKKLLQELRKWKPKELRRFHLSNANPSISLGVDVKSGYIRYFYSVYVVVGFDVEADEPKLKLKRITKYTKTYLKDYKDLNLRHIHKMVVKDMERYNKMVEVDSVNLPRWVEEYSTKTIRNGKELSPRTLHSDKQILGYYVDWLTKNEPAYLDVYQHIDGGKKVLEKYLNEMMRTKTKYGKPPSKNTIANSYRRIKSFFNWLSFEDNQFPFNMLRMKGYGIERSEDKIPLATSVDDMKVLIKWMDKNRENKYERHFIPILRMLLITGCRVSEVVEMKIEDIDFKEKQYQMFSKGKWRTIKLDSETLWEDLDYWLFDKKGKVRSDKEYVFHLEYWRKGNKDGKGGGVKMNLKKHISSSGIAHKFKSVIMGLNLDKRLTPHSCRRGFITYMLEKTDGDVPLVANIVGHSTWDMVRRYNRNRVPKQRTTIDLGEVLSNE